MKTYSDLRLMRFNSLYRGRGVSYSINIKRIVYALCLQDRAIQKDSNLINKIVPTSSKLKLFTHF